MTAGHFQSLEFSADRHQRPAAAAGPPWGGVRGPRRGHEPPARPGPLTQSRAPRPRHAGRCPSGSPSRARGNSGGEDLGSRGSDARAPRPGGGAPRLTFSRVPCASELARGGGERIQEARGARRRSRGGKLGPRASEEPAEAPARLVGGQSWPRTEPVASRPAQPLPRGSQTQRLRRRSPRCLPVHPRSGRAREAAGLELAWGCAWWRVLEDAAWTGERRFRSAELPAPQPGPGLASPPPHAGRAPAPALRGGPCASAPSS